MNLTIINEAWNEVVKEPVTDEIRADLLKQAKFKGRETGSVEAKEFVETLDPDTVTEELAARAQALYDANRIEGADREQVSIDIDEHGPRGIINCQVDGRHVQVRF